MKDFKNIDRLFQEKFRDFEQTPSPKVWSNIQATLYGKPKKNRRVLALWFSGVAAGLAILFSINNPFITTKSTNQNNTNTNNVTIDKSNNTTTEITNSTTENNKTTPEINTSLLENSTKNSKTTSPHKTTNVTDRKKSNTTTDFIANTENTKKTFVKNQIVQSQQILAKNTSPISIQKIKKTPKPEFKTTTQSEIPILAENLNSKEQSARKSLDNTIVQTDESETKTKSNKWILSTLAAPVMLNAFDSNSSIDSQFNSNDKQGQISASYGIQLAYKVTDRLIVQSGLHLVDYGYKTFDVFVSPDRYASSYDNISYDNGADLVDISADPSSVDNPVVQETRLTEAKGDLTQVFGYYEIPLEAKYALKKGDFGVNVLGGFSTLILNKNEIYVQSDTFSNKIGEASNLNNINLTGNLGLEFDYKIYQNIHFNVTPMIKVHANTFKKDTGGFNPYAIGVYSGLNFRF